MVIFPFEEIELVVDKDSLKPFAQSDFENLGDIRLVKTFEI